MYNYLLYTKVIIHVCVDTYIHLHDPVSLSVQAIHVIDFNQT